MKIRRYFNRMTNKPNRLTIICLSCLLIMILVSVTFAASPKNTVKKMEIGELDALISDQSYKGLVAVMASWCGPCRKELPGLNKLHEKYKSQGLGFAVISLDIDGPEAFQKVVDKAKVVLPVYWVGEAARKKYDVDAIPMLIIVKNGKIVEKIPGKRTQSYIEDKIKELLK